jgi:L-seryl-tRNA(Ser) seleniumtransferase
MKHMRKLKRRDLFHAGALTTAGLLTQNTGAATPGASRGRPRLYESLGVRPFLNLTGAYTINGGMLTLPEVKEAMDEASRFSVHMDELMAAVGQRLAELIQCEAAIVTSGCSAALTHATSACIAGGDPELIQQLPDLTGLKDEVVMLRRYTYDHAIRTLGVRIVTVGTREEFHSALSHRTAMVGVMGAAEARGAIRLEEVVEAAHKRGIPVLVDAAAHYPKSPDPYLSRGADLVAYSGGKLYRGPQCAGFLFGRRDLIDAAWLNGAPHHSFGRAMKVGKEEVMGALAAVEARFSRRNYDDEVEMWSDWLGRIAKRVEQVSGVSTSLVARPPSNPHSYLEVSWDRAKISYTAGELHDVLFDGEPRLQTLASGGGNKFPLRVSNIEEDQVEAVAERLYQVFRDAPRAKEARRASPATNLTGRWQADLKFVRGASTHQLYFEAEGNRLRGAHRGRNAEGAIHGIIDGDHVQFSSRMSYQGSTLNYDFTGRLIGDAMSGEVQLGEYGPATWQAKRRRVG